jgi:GNAT superfamily N-acetyltransferase
MSTPTEVLICTQQDYHQILDELHEFWGTRDTRHLHHPFLIHEFGNSAFVIRRGDQVIAYLFGFISQTEPVGYVHMVAVRTSARRQHLAHQLFHHFVQFARRHGCRHVKAITTPANLGSIAFHKSLGMQLLGEPDIDGISMIPGYAGRGAPRVVFWKSITATGSERLPPRRDLANE